MLLSISIYKVISTILVSSIKFAFAPFIAVLYGFNYIETVIITSIGGVLGIFFFYYLSSFILWLHRRVFPNRNNKTKKPPSLTKKKFTFRNKLIIRLKSNFGLIGIAFFTPIILSIPLGSFLAHRYYLKNKLVLPLMLSGVFFWAFVLTFIAKILSN